MYSRRFQILLLVIAVAPFSGCRFSSQGLGSFAMHGPCKTLGVDLRPGQGAIGPDVCIHDRCLGWVFARNKGPFHHILQGTTDPGCGDGNCRSLIGGSHTLAEQFPTDSGSPNPVVNQTVIRRGSPIPAAFPTPATQPASATYHLSSKAKQKVPRRTGATSSKPANRFAQQRSYDPYR